MLELILQKPCQGSPSQGSNISWREWSEAPSLENWAIPSVENFDTEILLLNLILLFCASHSFVLLVTVGAKQHHLQFFLLLKFLGCLNMIISSPRLNMPDSFKNVLDVIDLTVHLGWFLNVPSLPMFILQQFRGGLGCTETGWAFASFCTDSFLSLFSSSCFSYSLLALLLFPPLPSFPLLSCWFYLPLFIDSTIIPFAVDSY